MTDAPTRAVLGGRYELRHRIDSDESSELFLALDYATDQPVDVSLLFPPYGVEPSHVARFEAKVQVIARLDHANIVKTLGWGSHSDTLFVVKEHTEGSPLPDLLAAGGALPTTEAAAIAAEVAAVLAAAHRVGITHGDLTMSKIVVTTDGKVKVSDFGLAQAGSLHDDGGPYARGPIVETALSTLSMPASPRPAQSGQGSQTDDPHHDLRSLGVVLRQMVATGQSMPPTVPSELQPIIDSLIVVDGSSDGPTAASIERDLRQVSEGRPVTPSVTAETDVIKVRPQPPVARLTPAPRSGLPGFVATLLERDRPALRPNAPTAKPAAAPSNALPTPTPQPPAPQAAAPGAPAMLSAKAPTVLSAGSSTPDSTGPITKLAAEQPQPEEFDDLANSPLFLVTMVALLLILGGVIFYISAALSGGSQALDGNAIRVPTVVGDTQAVASARLTEAGLIVNQLLVVDEGTPPGIVVAQDPPSRGEIETGGVVTISIAQAPDTVAMPDVVDMTRIEAGEQLSALGFSVDIRRQTSDVVEADRVIEQSVRNGQEVGRGGEIILFVSSGPEQALIPNLKGIPLEQAGLQLEELKFTSVRIEYEPSLDISQGNVNRTEPLPDTQIELTTPITIFVSTGDHDLVPGMIGLTRGEAEQLLAGEGFQFSVQEVDVDPDSGLVGVVLSHHPEPEAMVPVGTHVTLRVGRERGSFFSQFFPDRNRPGNNDRD